MLLTKRNRNCQVLLILMLPVIAVSCYYDKEELLYPGNNQPPSCATAPATFNADVLPLVKSKCAFAGCHDATASGGLILQNYNQISAAKGMINTRVVIQKTMPPTGPLLPVQVNILKCWIEGGALNN